MLREIELPGGARVRGRSLRTPGHPVDFTLALADRPLPRWPGATVRRVRWPDFWVPLDTADAVDALADTLRRARAGQRVEVACTGGRGRTGTALAALAIMDGVPRPEAVSWVRRRYHPKAVELPWQRWWLRRVASVDE